MVLQFLAVMAAGSRVALALVFLTSGLSKIRRPRDFYEAVNSYDVGPRTVRLIAASFVPFAEVAVGLAWGSGYFQTATAVLTICILACFTSVVVVALRRSTPISSCGCSGILRAGPLSWGSAVRNGILATAAGFTLASSYLTDQLPRDSLARGGCAGTGGPAPSL